MYGELCRYEVSALSLGRTSCHLLSIVLVYDLPSPFYDSIHSTLLPNTTNKSLAANNNRYSFSGGMFVTCLTLFPAACSDGRCGGVGLHFVHLEQAARRAM